MNYNDYSYMQPPQGSAQYNYHNQTGYAQYPAYNQNYTYGWVDFRNPSYLKGFLIAAGVTLLVANPDVQKTLLKGAAKAWSGLQYGVEEVKEQINDIKAEMQFKKEQKAAGQESPGEAE